MEPFRPTVDRAVAEYMSTHDEPYGLEAAAKQQIIGELTGRYLMDGAQRTLFDVAARMAASLGRRFSGNAEELELPDFATHLQLMPCRDKNSFFRGIVECGCLRCSTCR